MNRGLWYIAVLVVLYLLISNFRSTQPTGVVAGATNSGSAPSSSHSVVYEVTTSRDSSVYPTCYGFDTTYEMPSGTSQKPVSICDGKTSTVVDKRSGNSGDFVYLSVQNDKQSARIGCEIYIDGKLAYQNYSQGQYVITDCSGRVE